MKQLFEQIKAHPLIACILLITPFVSGTLALSNWYLTRTQHFYDHLVMEKDEDISKLRQQLSTLKEKVAKITAPVNDVIASPHSMVELEDRLPLDLSVEGFFKKRKELHGNFSELENFTSLVEGKVVRWEGLVQSASWIDVEANIVLQSKGEGVVEVRVPASQKGRALALRTDDTISFMGWIRKAKGVVTVEAETFEITPNPAS